MADADKKMKAAFDKYDKDGNGYVTAAEVKAVIEDMLPGIDANVLEKIAKVSTINSLRPSDANMATMVSDNVGSGKGLLPGGTKPLPQPMLTNHH